MIDSDKLVIDFFCGISQDSAGRTIEQILRFDENNIENHHDFIQWIFPTMKRSDYNPNAPLISSNFKHLLSTNTVAKCNFCKTCKLFLNFIGLECDGKLIVIIEKATMFYDRPRHNLLRITRMLDSLNQIGKTSCSNNIFLLLKNIYETHNKNLKESFEYWEKTQLNEEH